MGFLFCTIAAFLTIYSTDRALSGVFSSLYDDRPILYGNGVWSDALTQLTELRSLTLEGINLFGTVPLGLFQLPNIEVLWLKGLPAFVTFPASISASLQKLYAELLRRSF